MFTKKRKEKERESISLDGRSMDKRWRQERQEHRVKIERPSLETSLVPWYPR